MEMLLKIKKPIYTLHAINNPLSASKFSSEEFNGLKNKINLQIGSPVVLKLNVWTAAGLTNGATGIIHDIIYDEDEYKLDES